MGWEGERVGSRQEEWGRKGERVGIDRRGSGMRREWG